MNDSKDYLKHTKRRGYKRRRVIKDTDVQLADQVASGVPVKTAKENLGLTPNSLMPAGAKEVMEFKQNQMREMMMEDAVAVYNNMKDLAFNARSEMVRMQASKDILDRAGLAPVQKTENTEQKFITTDSKITYDLLQRFNQLELQGDKYNPAITTIDARNNTKKGQ